MKYKYYLCDWDGCLANTLQIWLESTRSVLKKHGIEVSDYQIVKDIFGKWDGSEKYGLSSEIYGPELSAEILPLVQTVVLNETVLPFLQKVKDQGGSCTVVSTSRRSAIEAALEHNNVAEYFDAIVSSDDVNQTKPHPEPLQKALMYSGGTVEEALMIGDNIVDVEAAKTIGMDSVIFYPKVNQYFYNLDLLRSSEPKAIVEDLGDIFEL